MSEDEKVGQSHDYPQYEVDLTGAWDKASLVGEFMEWLRAADFYREGLLYRLIDSRYPSSVYGLQEDSDDPFAEDYDWAGERKYPLDGPEVFDSVEWVHGSTEAQLLNIYSGTSAFYYLNLQEPEAQPAIVIYDAAKMEGGGETSYAFLDERNKREAVIAMLRLRLADV